MPTLRTVSALVFCLMVCLPSYALTPVSACGTYSVNDKYVVQEDISSSSTTVACLHFTGISSAANGIDIDLNGHNVVSTAYHALDIDTSVGSVYLHDSVGTGSYKGKVGFGGSGPYVVSAIYILNSATSPDARILITGIRAYGEIRVESTDKTAFPMKTFHSEYNHIYNGGWTLIKIGNPYQTGEYVDNRYDSTIVVQGGLSAYDCDSPRIEYSTIVGGPGSNAYSTTLNSDDAVLISCSNVSTPCTGGTMDHVTSYDMFDAMFEFSGALTDLRINNNVGYRMKVAGIGGYGVYSPSMSFSEIKNNTVKTSLRLFMVYGNPNNTGFFNNNNISGNTIDSSPSSFIGGTGGIWPVYTGNTIANNNFGTGSTLTLQSSAGVIDGGGNHCLISSPGGITCQ